MLDGLAWKLGSECPSAVTCEIPYRITGELWWIIHLTRTAESVCTKDGRLPSFSSFNMLGNWFGIMKFIGKRSLCIAKLLLGCSMIFLVLRDGPKLSALSLKDRHRHPSVHMKPVLHMNDKELPRIMADEWLICSD